MYDKREYQENAITNVKNSFKQGHNKTILTAPTGCVSGDTILNLNRAKNGYKRTIKREYEIEKHGRRNINVKNMIRSFIGDRIGLNEAIEVVYSGNKCTMELILDNGFKIRATPEHLIMTKSGWKELQFLTNNNFVMVDRPIKKIKKKSIKKNYMQAQGLIYHPFAGHCKSNREGRLYRVPYHRLVYEAYFNGVSVEDLIKICRTDKITADCFDYINPEFYAIHHIDLNHKNNNVHNLEKLSHPDHSKKHGVAGNWKSFGLNQVQYSKVVSVIRFGVEPVYDVRCKEPYHNFIGNGIVVHNSGKSYIALKIIINSLMKGKRVAFLVDRITLLDQICNTVYESGITEFGIMQADNPLYKPELSLQFITAQTLGRRDVEPFDLVIWDECHIVYKSVLDVMEKWDKSYWIGLTATPFTLGLKEIWDDLVVSVSVAELIKDGYLSQYKAFGGEIPDLKGIKMSAGDYNKKDLAVRSSKAKLIADIVSTWKKLGDNRQTVVGAVNIAHAELIAEKFKSQDIPADVIHCRMPREEIKRKLQDFLTGEIRVLSSVDLISRGFDMPTLGCVIVARPTKSLNYHLQFLGRGLRASPGKENLIILDHAGNILRPGLGFPDDSFDMELRGKLKKKQEVKKKEKLPVLCPECKTLTGRGLCPECGFKFKAQSKVETAPGELKELQRKETQKKNYANSTTKQRLILYAKLLAAAKANGFKDGWAAHKVKEKYGVWPQKRVEIDQGFYSFLIGIDNKKRNSIIWGLVK